MHTHFQYIKCWLDKGFNELDKINKKSRYFFLRFITLGFEFISITSRNKMYGSRSENL